MIRDDWHFHPIGWSPNKAASISFFPSANARWAAALEALQLCLKLLPAACRDELSRLLTFMSLAADPQEIKLNQEVRAASNCTPFI